METAKERFNTIVAETNHYCKENNIDIDTCKNLTLDNVLKNWQKDIDKVKELEAKILSLECDNNELQEEVNHFRNESLVEKAEKKKLAKKAFNAGVKYGNYHSLDEELSELLSNETFNFEDWYNKEVQ